MRPQEARRRTIVARDYVARAPLLPHFHCRRVASRHFSIYDIAPERYIIITPPATRKPCALVYAADGAKEDI